MVESEFACFLCLNQCISSETSFTVTSKSDLSIFANYLKCYPEKDENTSICELCEDLLRTFSNLLRALEIAQMKVDSCVKQVRDVMLERNENGEMENNLKTTRRKDLILMSSLHLKQSKSQPIVKLAKTQVGSAPVPVPQPQPQLPILNPDELKQECEYVEVKPEVEYTEGDYAMSPVEDLDPLFNQDADCEMSIDQNFKLETAPQPKPSLHILTPIENNDSDPNYFVCPVCQAEFKRGGNTLLRLHIAHNHCEYYFPTQKLGTVSDLQFRKILSQLLFQDYLEAKSCSYCPQEFSTPNQIAYKQAHYPRIKLHYLENHYEILEERLMAIQTDPCLSDLMEECDSELKEDG